VTDWESVRHQVAIAGRVQDAQTGQPMAGAQIGITAAPTEFTDWLAIRAMQYGDSWATLTERPDRTRAAVDGHFHFLDLPDGQYTLVAAMPGSGSRFSVAQAVVSVSRDAQGHINMVAAALALPPTTLKGQIIGQSAAPVAMAEVRVKGSGEWTFSDGQGQYLLSGLEVGKRTVLVSAQGYQAASQVIDLGQAGTVQTVNFTLVPSTS
jgi:hypothetical protein